MIKLVVEMMQQKYFLLVSLLPQFLYFLYISQILISHIQLLIFKYVLSACFGFAFCLLYGESEDWKIWLCPQGLTQSRTSVGPQMFTRRSRKTTSSGRHIGRLSSTIPLHILTSWMEEFNLACLPFPHGPQDPA